MKRFEMSRRAREEFPCDGCGEKIHVGDSWTFRKEDGEESRLCDECVAFGPPDYTSPSIPEQMGALIGMC